MVEQGIIMGFEDGTFKPDEGMDPIALANIVLRTMTFMNASTEDEAEGETGTATDSVTWGTGMESIMKITGCDAETLEGFIEGEVDEKAAITRLEFCELLAKAMGLEPSEAEPVLSDTDSGYIQALVELGILTGNTDGTFDPDGELNNTALSFIFLKAMTVNNKAA